MSVQPVVPSPRRPLPRRVETRRRRIDPPNAFQTIHVFSREPERPAWIHTADPALTQAVASPLIAPATPAAAPRRNRGWLTMLAASVALHAAIAAFFLFSGVSDDDVMIAGSEEAGIVMLGDSAADQQAEGDVLDQATIVTLVTMLDATPVETVDATAVVTADTLQPVIEVAEAAVTDEAVQPVQEEALAQAPPPEPVQVEQQPVEPSPVPEAAIQPLAEAATSVAVDRLPDVLATETAEIVPDELAVAPAAPVQQALTAPSEAAVQEAVETVPVELPPVETARPAEAETLQPVPDTPVVAEAPKPVEPVKPEPKKAQPKPAEPKKAEAKKAEPKKAEARKAVEKPAKAVTPPGKKAEANRKAGSGGANASDARRGKADGQAEGTRTETAGKGKSNAAGNAAVTNYPGKVRSKISRSVRRIPASARRGANGDVVVAFTVSGSGSLGGVRVSRSSGSSSLDQAALEAVRRAAPFPPIPDGRASWPFTIPLGLR